MPWIRVLFMFNKNASGLYPEAAHNKKSVPNSCYSILLVAKNRVILYILNHGFLRSEIAFRARFLRFGIQSIVAILAQEIMDAVSAIARRVFAFASSVSTKILARKVIFHTAPQ